LAFAILFGVYPQFIFSYMTPSVNQSVTDLAEWTKTVKDPSQSGLNETVAAKRGSSAAPALTESTQSN
jgi:hypothetical protein